MQYLLWPLGKGCVLSICRRTTFRRALQAAEPLDFSPQQTRIIGTAAFELLTFSVGRHEATGSADKGSMISEFFFSSVGNL